MSLLATAGESATIILIVVRVDGEWRRERLRPRVRITQMCLNVAKQSEIGIILSTGGGDPLRASRLGVEALAEEASARSNFTSSESGLASNAA